MTTRFHAHPFPLDMAHRDHDYDVGGVALAVGTFLLIVLLSSLVPVGSSVR